MFKIIWMRMSFFYVSYFLFSWRNHNKYILNKLILYLLNICKYDLLQTSLCDKKGL